MNSIINKVIVVNTNDYNRECNTYEFNDYNTLKKFCENEFKYTLVNSVRNGCKNSNGIECIVCDTPKGEAYGETYVFIYTPDNFIHYLTEIIKRAKTFPVEITITSNIKIT